MAAAGRKTRQKVCLGVRAGVLSAKGPASHPLPGRLALCRPACSLAVSHRPHAGHSPTGDAGSQTNGLPRIHVRDPSRRNSRPPPGRCTGHGRLSAASGRPMPNTADMVPTPPTPDSSLGRNHGSTLLPNSGKRHADSDAPGRCRSILASNLRRARPEFLGKPRIN